jgi:hypothetical protein
MSSVRKIASSLVSKAYALLTMLPLSVSYILLISAIAILFYVHPKDGADYRWYWTLARCIIDGKNPYNQSIRDYYVTLHPISFKLPIMPYPPSTGILLAPLGYLPFTVGTYIYKIVSLAILISGIYRLTSSVTKQLTLKLFVPIVSILLFWAPARWASSNLQLVTLMAGCYCWLVVALLRKNHLAAVALTAVCLCLKFTDALPMLLLLALVRNYRGILVAISITIATNVIGFIRFGGLSTIGDYLNELRSFSSHSDPVDAISPHIPKAGLRVDWTYFLNGLYDGFPYAQVISLVALAGFIAVILRVCSLDDLAPTLMLATTVGLSWTYHHVYAYLYLVPVLAIAFVTKSKPTARLFNGALLLIGLYGFLTATNIMVRLADSAFGHWGGVVVKMYPSVLFLFCTVSAIVAIVHERYKKSGLQVSEAQ